MSFYTSISGIPESGDVSRRRFAPPRRLGLYAVANALAGGSAGHVALSRKICRYGEFVLLVCYRDGRSAFPVSLMLHRKSERAYALVSRHLPDSTRCRASDIPDKIFFQPGAAAFRGCCPRVLLRPETQRKHQPLSLRCDQGLLPDARIPLPAADSIADAIKAAGLIPTAPVVVSQRVAPERNNTAKESTRAPNTFMQVPRTGRASITGYG